MLFRSLNVLPAWLGEKTATPPREFLVLQNNGQSPLALRQGDWVLIQKGPGQRPQTNAAPNFELYNLATDLSETKNLAAANPEKVKELTQRLESLKAAGLAAPSTR